MRGAIKVEVAPGRFKRLSRCTAKERKRASEIAVAKAGVSQRCAELLEAFAPFLPMDIPPWVSPYTLRVLTEGVLGEPTLPELIREREDLECMLATANPGCV